MNLNSCLRLNASRDGVPRTFMVNGTSEGSASVNELLKGFH